ncbi:MAG: hypothetical protein PHN31_00680 [Candidatus Gracilibacteria bacterium]|nr:hypothetical protein [Candidatus Gracilibacteria bacterium]
MVSYIIKMLTMIVFSSFSIFSYYSIFSFHAESFSTIIFKGYLLPLVIIYIIYKVLSLYVFNERSDKIEINYFTVLFYAFVHLFLLCIVYFVTKEGFSGADGIGLFFKILGYLILPTTIFITSYGFGRRILGFINGFKDEEYTFKFLSSLGIGFFSFVALLFIGALFGFYNLYLFFIIILLFIIFGYKGTGKLLKTFFTKKIEFSNNINLYTSEFLFIILTALISTNLILVFRPFPIGWDDLGSYMNTPHLISAAGKMISFGGMQAWEIYTGVGFLFGSTTQAFYLNTFSGILASIILYMFAKSFFGKKNEFVNIPLLLITIFISLPMVIFQLGKDMKLDIGLFSISLIGIYMIYYIFVKKEDYFADSNYLEVDENKFSVKNLFKKVSKKEFFKKEDYYFMFIAGIIVGFSFAIKFTTLMLISAVLGLILFNRIGFIAFLGYLAIYFAVFTKLHLWDMMNVVYPKDNALFVNIFSVVSFVMGLFMFVFEFSRNNKNYIIKTFQIIGVFLVGIFIALIPRLGKNVSESGLSRLSVGTLIGGKSIIYNADYSKIYSSDELKKIQDKINKRTSLDANGQAANADMGRYFGYEKGINNYLKLPYSLSMQTNQRGEYTDITYIFFALLPILFLFLPLTKKYYYFFIYFAIIFEILYLILPGSSTVITNLISSIELPLGYIFILLVFLLPLLFFKLTTNYKNDKVMKLFLVNFAFAAFYIFLWDIAAFGIVWYGIILYFNLLILIGVGIYYVTIDDNNIDSNETFYTVKVINFLAIFVVISIYFIRSTIPHMFANFDEDSYMHYKSGKIQEYEAIFMYHSDYLSVLYELNIKDEKKAEFLNNYKKQIYDFMIGNKFDSGITKAIEQINNIDTLNQVLFTLINDQKFQTSLNNTPVYTNMVQLLTKIRKDIYVNILSPSADYKSDAIIYRLGTFLKYFVTENNYRLYDDSLVFNFDDYVYDKDINKTVDNFEKIGMKYLLLDLNTPTIDKDPNHTLTTRFENLLKTLTSDRVSVIDSDSLCLRTAIDLYKKSEKTDKDMKTYLALAGVNFESYENGTEINRVQKLTNCYKTILYLFDNKFVTNGNFSYLQSIKDELENQKLTNEEDKYRFLYSKIPSGYKALFKFN